MRSGDEVSLDESYTTLTVLTEIEALFMMFVLHIVYTFTVSILEER